MNSNQEPQKVMPPPVRTPFDVAQDKQAPDAAPPSNLPAESNLSQPEISVRTMAGDVKSLEAGIKFPKAQAVLPPTMKDVKASP